MEAIYNELLPHRPCPRPPSPRCNIGDYGIIYQISAVALGYICRAGEGGGGEFDVAANDAIQIICQ